MDNRPPAPKVAIPRLDHDRKSPQNRHGKSRARKACDNCRKRKAKCSGEQPHCRNCGDQHVPCIYSQARRDRLKEATEQNSELIALLKDLAAHVDDVGKKKIDGLLDSLGDDGSTHAPNMALETLEKRSREGSAANEGSRCDPSLGETRISRSVGSNDDLDLLDEDLLRSRESRATGFVGQNSEVQWLRGLKSQVGSASLGGILDGLPYGARGSSHETAAQRADALHARQESSKSGGVFHVSDSTFYLDGDDPLQPPILVSSSPTTLGEQQPAQAFEEFQPDQSLMLNAGLHMPLTFGNPFITSLDQPNPLNTPLSMSRDG